jgi:hypothetical protein
MKPLKNDFLVTYLGIVDDGLLKYLDDADELSLDVVEGLQEWALALLDGSITPASLRLEWPEWFHLASAFVFAYGSGDLEELEHAAVSLRAVEGDDEVGLTGADRSYLKVLESQLGMYPEMRDRLGLAFKEPLRKDYRLAGRGGADVRVGIDGRDWVAYFTRSIARRRETALSVPGRRGDIGMPE